MSSQEQSQQQAQAQLDVKANATYAEPTVLEEAPLTSVTGSSKTTTD